MLAVVVVLWMSGCGGAATVADQPNNSQVEAAKTPEARGEEQGGDAEEQRIHAETVDTHIKIDLPAVPDLAVPVANADGSHPTREMQLNGKAYLGKEVRITGTVLWIYDCSQAIRTPEMSDRDIKALLETQPERCTRPHFTLGEARASPIDGGVQVVEYPRHLRKDEKMAFSDEIVTEIENAVAAMPAFKVGDAVMVTGTWSLSSPRGFHNSEGLLIYASMVNLTTGSSKK